jgi:nitrogen fixation/metabolism regulation signal transduction histidine kinase
LCGIVLGVGAAISQFTNRLLARPLTLLEAGITSVREGRLEPIRVSRTGDEIEYLGDSFNRMIAALAASQDEIRQYQELLEERIRQRTQELEKAMHGALAASWTWCWTAMWAGNSASRWRLPSAAPTRSWTC